MTTIKATLNDTVLAESNETILIEGNHYFPPDSIKKDYFKPTDLHTTCPWKGEASYYTVTVGDVELENAAWYYPEISQMALERVKKDFSDYVAFYPSVTVS